MFQTAGMDPIHHPGGGLMGIRMQRSALLEQVVAATWLPSQPIRHATRFTVTSLATHQSRMEVRSCWNQLFCRNDRPGAIYQSDSYDEFRRESGDVVCNLPATTETEPNGVVGIVPLKATEIGLQFMLRSKLMYRLRPHGLMLLGSEPMLVEEPEAFDSLFLHLARHHPEASAISLMAVREGSFTWRHLATSAVIREHFYVYKPEGLRNCHAVEVPASLDAYHRGLGKKRRYNLQRQERLLSEHLGDELTLVAIDRASRLHELYRAIEQLGATDDAILSPEHYALACKHGLLLCYVLRAGSRVVGLALGSQCRRTFLVHRLFHDSSLQRFSPGTALWQHMLRDLIGNGRFDRVEMGFGDPAYRHHTTNIIEQRARILLLRRTVVNRLRIEAHRGFYAALASISQRMREIRLRRQGALPVAAKPDPS